MKNRDNSVKIELETGTVRKVIVGDRDGVEFGELRDEKGFKVMFWYGGRECNSCRIISLGKKVMFLNRPARSPEIDDQVVFIRNPKIPTATLYWGYSQYFVKALEKIANPDSVALYRVQTRTRVNDSKDFGAYHPRFDEGLSFEKLMEICPRGGEDDFLAEEFHGKSGVDQNYFEFSLDGGKSWKGCSDPRLIGEIVAVIFSEDGEKGKDHPTPAPSPPQTQMVPAPISVLSAEDEDEDSRSLLEEVARAGSRNCGAELKRSRAAERKSWRRRTTSAVA